MVHSTRAVEELERQIRGRTSVETTTSFFDEFLVTFFDDDELFVEGIASDLLKVTKALFDHHGGKTHPRCAILISGGGEGPPLYQSEPSLGSDLLAFGSTHWHFVKLSQNPPTNERSLTEWYMSPMSGMTALLASSRW